MKKVFLQLLFSVLLFSCSTEENPVEEQQPQDSKPPQIVVSSLSSTIETVSNVQVSITDDSTVKTSVYIDDVLVTEENSKNFSVEIDPFDFTTGSKTLKVVSTDSGNNEASKEFDFELKKLLFVLPNPISDNALGSDRDQFISINFNDGSLYMAKKIESDEDGKFYANDDFERQNFTVSLYGIANSAPRNEHIISSFANIEPGTVVMPASERWSHFNLGSLPRNASELLDLSELEKPMIFSYNSNASATGGGQYLFNYSSETSEKFFLFNFPNSGDLESDYTYTWITDLEKTIYSSSDLSTAENFTTVEIPVKNNFFLGVDGYQTESDYKENKFYRVLAVNESTTSTYPVKVPVFPDLFEVYNLTYSYPLDNRSIFYSKQKGLEVSLPTNQFVINRNGQTIGIAGEHDYSRIIFEYTQNTNDVYSIFKWTYNFKESQSVSIPFENFEIPEEVLNLFQERQVVPKPGMLTNNNYYMLDFEVYNYAEPIIYENMMFGSSYNQNEGGDVSWVTYNLKI